jgi:hypothetical protein
MIMGSGDRFTLSRSEGFGLGLFVCRFPFALTINVSFLLWHLSAGFGKGYDQ